MEESDSAPIEQSLNQAKAQLSKSNKKQITAEQI